jgi:2-oxoisovalerate dehydrogenase E2 component (dihydrolipoyl transacylase)
VPPAVSAVQRFLLPDLGEGLTEAEIVAWRVAAGEDVALNQVVAEVETEKAVVELPSPFAGTVVELFAGPGETVGVGAPLLAIETGGDGGTDEADGTEEADGTGEADGTAEVEEHVPMLVGYGPSESPPSRRRRSGRGGHRERVPGPTAAPPRSGRPLAAPPVRFIARQHGVDLADVTGHGPGGVITRDDLAAHLAGSSGPARETRAPVRGVQKHMAEAMVRSVATAPQACVFLTVDVTPTVDLVERLRQHPRFEGIHLTPLAVVARAAVLALGDHPTLNTSWDEASAEVVTKRYVHLGIAVAGPRGLVVPNIKDAQDLALRPLAAALADLTERARADRCTPADLRGATITLTNVGVFGVDAGVPILNPGEAAILAVGAVQRRPWEFAGEVALRHVVTLSLAFDHRLVDGQAASLFLRDVGAVLADPTTLLALA